MMDKIKNFFRQRMSLPVTEDTPPDMLAGSMDLNMVLPNGKTVKMSVQRGTPMMDLLVQATTAHCLSPGDYSLQAMGDKGVLPFKPNTPIGALDTFTVKIVEKKSQNRARAPQGPLSFLNTFRLQVHLPRSQLFVLRVTPDISLSEIMTHICTEKNLNLEKYEFRNPGKLDEVLDLDKTLGDYKLQELTLVSKGNRTVTSLMSSADMIKLKSSKHRQNSVCDSSLSSGSFGSHSGSPVQMKKVTLTPPQPPIRKKRKPAPKPPPLVEKEKKKDLNTGPVLISHSRESSDSSGYHEASVLSESPTHGGPAGDSPPDTLPRRSKLPSSQSFTNLTSIQPTSKGRLVNSISNTSLNSNGYSRKKRAPPPPQMPNHQTTREDKIKSSTLPSSIREERRLGFLTECNFTSAKVDDVVDDDDGGDGEEGGDEDDVAGTPLSNAKVQSPIELTSLVINETKVSREESPSAVDVDKRLLPKPKPRTVLLSSPPARPSSTDLKCDASSSRRRTPNRLSLSRLNNLENLNEEDDEDDDDDDDDGDKGNGKPGKTVAVSGKVSSNDVCASVTTTTTTTTIERYQLVKFIRCKLEGCGSGGGDLETLRESLRARKTDGLKETSPVENVDPVDHDSISWEYQLPPPPTDFRDTNSPNVTEFGTITITPDVLEGGEPRPEVQSSPKIENRVVERPPPSPQQQQQQHQHQQLPPPKSHHKVTLDTCYVDETVSDRMRPFGSGKSDVMNELTNILNGARKTKEKSLSVSNLYLNDPVYDLRKHSTLSYSKSFSTEPLVTGYAWSCKAINGRPEDDENVVRNNRHLSRSNDSCDSDITYRNYRNLEKSSSMECIQGGHMDHGTGAYFIDRNGDEVFRRPVAPVQKKLKVARRSASTIASNGPNPNRRHTLQNGQSKDEWLDDPSLNALQQQFLEFLREKKLNADLKMKSLDVIRNILPEVVNGGSNGREDGVLSSHRETAVAEEAEEVVDRAREVKVQASPKKVSTNSHKSAQQESGRGGEERQEKETRQSDGDKVKVVDVKVKSPKKEEEQQETEDVVLRRVSPERRVPAEGQGTGANRRESSTKLSEEKRQDLTKRYSYQGPPSINFATWGERPKTTRILIKDEDYVTQEKVALKKTEMTQSRAAAAAAAAAATTTVAKPVETVVPSQKPKEVSKRIIIKKPGTLSHYEMFSALPRRKEISSLKLVYMEDEEKRRLNNLNNSSSNSQNSNSNDSIYNGTSSHVNNNNNSSSRMNDPKEFNRVPVVCGMELKKEFREGTTGGKPCPPSQPPPPVPPSRPRSPSPPPATKHSTSVYVNGHDPLDGEKRPSQGFMVPMRNPTLMPVVKGFRAFAANGTTTQAGAKLNGDAEAEDEPVGRQRWTPTALKPTMVNGSAAVPPPPPPPPNINAVKLKPVGSVQVRPKTTAVTMTQDPRTQLLDEIRNFGGLRSLKRSAVH